MNGPELRQDPTTKDWVVIAAGRAKRPHAFAESKPASSALTYDPSCPFCVGNEALTPPEVYRDNDTSGAWRVRVVPNKFAALTPDAKTERTEGFFRRAPGVGYHEVVIETPDHAGDLADLSVEHVARVLRAYRERQRALSLDPRVRFVIIFRNHGERAGTSLAHPHSQIVATPIVPAYMRRRHEIAERHFDDTGRCLYRDVQEAERADGSRLVEDTDGFMVFVPFASHVPFETWIVPHTLRPSFVLVTDEELDNLARVLRNSLRRLRACLGDVDYNYIVHSSPRKDEDEDYYLWHVQIVPRLTRPAGFEIGSHMSINTVEPEAAAEQLRAVRGEELS